VADEHTAITQIKVNCAKYSKTTNPCWDRTCAWNKNTVWRIASKWTL